MHSPKQVPVTVEIDRLFRAAESLEAAQEALTALYVATERELDRAMVQRALDRVEERQRLCRTIEGQLLDAQERLARAQRYLATVEGNLERARVPDLSDKRRTPR
jgi:hypothetical protein